MGCGGGSWVVLGFYGGGGGLEFDIGYSNNKQIRYKATVIM